MVILEVTLTGLEITRKRTVYGTSTFKFLGIPLLNFAESGATTNNAIHLREGVKDTHQQVRDYMASWILARDQKKDIIAMCTTTNDTTLTWNNPTAAVQALDGQAPLEAIREIARSAQVLVDQLTWLTDEKHACPDFLIFPMLPVELTLQNLKGQTAAGVPNSDAMRAITQRYNEVLLAGAQNIANSIKGRGNVYTFDIYGWFINMIGEPQKYGLKIVDQPCKQEVQSCSEPETYIWSDDLHLLNHMHCKMIAIPASLISDTALPEFIS